MEYRIGDPVDTQIAILGTFEPALTSIVEQLTKRYGTFIDIGCNIGYFTCLYAMLNRSARILAIDANPNMVERTQKNLRLMIESLIAKGFPSCTWGWEIGSPH